MKKLMTLAIFFGFLIITAQEKKSGTIQLQIDNMENDKGQMLIGLYDSEDNWLSKIYVGKVAKITDGSAEITFKNVPLGVYAISVFHDEDNNGKLKTFLGIPTESTGSSNNAPARFGPPKWEDAKFTLTEKTVHQKISL
ncbi:DUF2141 domain-containing protein [Maribacter sp. MJ134]|uniref:DUF2141 domain-containing protein n=1 Tax=Maribacter sp. MJ134 TaxID=2496865 RepID=UPI000F8394FA|nr:DUF2141 domain-containing protein [Maribacter sp. MJ134]AZQ57794.1 DUF2141 domain-containing protein [Maribacter sp. MJ134]